ncbi:MAG TPA: MFS transporter [Steroidobacteraceae bacterium]|nr:MFS transporter [Steroidobacteraceae bacterium]
MNPVIDVEKLVDEQRLGRFNLNLFVWSFLAMFADGYDLAVMAFATPELVRLWHVPPDSLRMALVASLIGIVFGALLFGVIGDRFGRKRAIVIGCLVYGLASFAIVPAEDLTQVAWLRFLTGIGLGGVMPNTIALNSELSPRRWRATLIVLMFVGITLGAVAPGLVSAGLVAGHGWTILFLIGGMAPLVIAAGVALYLPESVKLLARQPDRRATLLKTARSLRRDLAIPDDAVFQVQRAAELAGSGLRQIFSGGLAPITTLLWVLFAAALLSNFFLNGWLPLIFTGNGLTAHEAAVATTWYHVGAALGGIAVSVVLDRFGVMIIAVLFALAGPCVAAIGWPGHSFAMLALLVALSGFTVVGAIFGINASAGLLYATEFRSKGVGWAFAVGRVGSIAGILIGGALIARHLPLPQLFLAPAAPMAVGAFAAFGLVYFCYRRFRGFKLDDVPAS